MDKKEIAEIRKNFMPEGCVIQKMRTCYVNGDKEVVCKESVRNFYALPEEDAFKYLEIAKKGLSGKLGKNLACLETADGVKPITGLARSGMEDDGAADAVFSSIIENFNCPDNFFIVLFYITYDVPVKGTDGKMQDESDTVYQAVLACICPVTLSKAGLSYVPEKNQITDSGRSRFVEMPQEAFLYPSFNGRMEDYGEVLYYTKNADQPDKALVEGVLGCAAPAPASLQKEAVAEMVGASLGRRHDFEAAKEIREGLLDEGKVDCDGMSDIMRMVTDNEEALEEAADRFGKLLGPDTAVHAENISDANKVKISTTGVEVTVKADQMGRVSVKDTGGRKQLVIDLDLPYQFDGIDTY